MKKTSSALLVFSVICRSKLIFSPSAVWLSVPPGKSSTVVVDMVDTGGWNPHRSCVRTRPQAGGGVGGVGLLPRERRGGEGGRGRHRAWVSQRQVRWRRGPRLPSGSRAVAFMGPHHQCSKRKRAQCACWRGETEQCGQVPRWPSRGAANWRGRYGFGCAAPLGVHYEVCWHTQRNGAEEVTGCPEVALCPPAFAPPNETKRRARLTRALQWADIYGEIDRRAGQVPRGPRSTLVTLICVA